MKNKITALLALLFFAFHSQLIAEDDWTEDIDAAIELAEKEDKDVLVLFTGSDWCPPCIKLEKEVLSKEDFLKEIKPGFVLVKLDFPRSTPQGEGIAARNQEWSEKFGIDGYPTILLMDPKEKPFGFTGYEDGGVENYLGLLEELRQARIRRDDFLKAAEKKEGLDRATWLDKAMSELNEEIVAIYYADIVEEIVKLDAEDDLGLRTKWNEAKDSELRKIILTDIMTVARLEKPDRAVEFIDEVKKEVAFTPEELLQVLQIKLNLLQKLKRSDDVYSLLDEMIAVDGVEGTVRERLVVKKILLMTGAGQRDEAMKLLDDSLAGGGDNLFLSLAKGELLDSERKYEEAIAAYEVAIPRASYNPDLLADLVSAKADALFELDKGQEALQALDNFSDDTQMPSDLRSEILLHKAMILRDQDRRRLAILAENRAIEISEAGPERTEMQKIVEKLRKKYEDK